MPFLMLTYIDVRTVKFFPPLESWLVNSNFPHANCVQGNAEIYANTISQCLPLYQTIAQSRYSPPPGYSSKTRSSSSLSTVLNSDFSNLSHRNCTCPYISSCAFCMNSSKWCNFLYNRTLPVPGQPWVQGEGWSKACSRHECQSFRLQVVGLPSTLTNRNELISNCRHSTKFLLKNVLA